MTMIPLNTEKRHKHLSHKTMVTDDRHTERRTDKWTDRQVDRQTDRQEDRMRDITLHDRKEWNGMEWHTYTFSCTEDRMEWKLSSCLMRYL